MSKANKLSILEMYSKKSKPKKAKKSINLVAENEFIEMINYVASSRIDFNRFIIDSLTKNGIKALYKELQLEQKEKDKNVEITANSNEETE